MALVGKHQKSEREETPDHLRCKLLGNRNDEAITTSGQFSRPPDLTDFSFPMLPSAGETYAADKKILHGRLLPFNIPPSSQTNRIKTEKLVQIPSFNHRRGKSIDGGARNALSDAGHADYVWLRRAPSDPRPMPESGKFPKWTLFLLGSYRFPEKMEMKDIRNRQRWRCPISAEDVTENSRPKSLCQILRALSCKAAENAFIEPVRAR